MQFHAGFQPTKLSIQTEYKSLAPYLKTEAHEAFSQSWHSFFWLNQDFDLGSIKTTAITKENTFGDCDSKGNPTWKTRSVHKTLAVQQIIGKLISQYIPKQGQRAEISDFTLMEQYWEEYGPLFTVPENNNNQSMENEIRHRMAIKRFLGTCYSTALILSFWNTTSSFKKLNATPATTSEDIMDILYTQEWKLFGRGYYIWLELWKEDTFSPHWRGGLHPFKPINHGDETFFPLAFTVNRKDIKHLVDNQKDPKCAIKWLQDKFLSCISHVLENTPARIKPIQDKGKINLAFQIDGNLIFFLIKEIERSGRRCQYSKCSAPLEKNQRFYCSKSCGDKARNLANPRKQVIENIRKRFRDGEIKGNLKYNEGQHTDFKNLIKEVNRRFDEGESAKYILEYAREAIHQLRQKAKRGSSEN